MEMDHSFVDGSSGSASTYVSILLRKGCFYACASTLHADNVAGLASLDAIYTGEFRRLDDVVMRSLGVLLTEELHGWLQLSPGVGI
jgi:hypothetical protein